VIDRTFQLIRGVGPAREKELWCRGVKTWDDLPRNEIALSAKQDPPLRAAIEVARAALAAGDPGALTAMIPSRERWRMLAPFGAEAAYLDIETDGTHADAQVTCVGVLHRGRVRAFVSGFNLHQFPAFAAELQLLVTFNGSCFDVPVLERFFPGLRLPRAHIDARFAARRAGLDGGLKRLEGELGLARPPALQGVGGADAVTLWHAWRHARDRTALRKLVTYNLYDAVLLEPVMARLVNRMRERALSGAPPVPEPPRDWRAEIDRVSGAF